MISTKTSSRNIAIQEQPRYPAGIVRGMGAFRPGPLRLATRRDRDVPALCTSRPDAAATCLWCGHDWH